MGLYFIIQGILDAVYAAILHGARDEVSGQLFSDNTIYAELGTAVVSLAIGTVLLLGAGGLVAMLHRLREGGLSEKRPASNSQ